MRFLSNKNILSFSEAATVQMLQGGSSHTARWSTHFGQFPRFLRIVFTVDLNQVVQWLALAEKGRKWDEESSTPMFEYRWLGGAKTYLVLIEFHFTDDFLREGSQDFQVWYDDPQSLAIKYQVRLWIKLLIWTFEHKVAKLLGMRGAGFWTSNFLDYSNTAMVEEMWDAIPQINMS